MVLIIRISCSCWLADKVNPWSCHMSCRHTPFNTTRWPFNRKFWPSVLNSLKPVRQLQRSCAEGVFTSARKVYRFGSSGDHRARFLRSKVISTSVLPACNEMSLVAVATTDLPHMSESSQEPDCAAADATETLALQKAPW